MTASTARQIMPREDAETPRPNIARRWLGSVKEILTSRQGLLGTVMVVGIFAIIVLGRLWTPYDPLAIGVGPSGSGPSAAHWLGTDDLGRDVFSRFLTGGASVLAVPLIATSIAFLVGGSIGMIFGYVGGLGDRILARVLDVLLPIPDLLVTLLLIAHFGSSIAVLIAIVAGGFSPRICRILRGSVQNLKAMEYILAAEARGERRRNIVFSELLPNITGPALVEFGIRVNFAVVFVSSLNFLGLAEYPPSSNWGLMVGLGRNLIFSNPAAALVPAAAIAILVVGINLIADSAAGTFSSELNTGWAQ